jgi:hypothetical protein
MILAPFSPTSNVLFGFFTMAQLLGRAKHQVAIFSSLGTVPIT